MRFKRIVLFVNDHIMLCRYVQVFKKFHFWLENEIDMLTYYWIELLKVFDKN